jgi:hypothetical protein
MASHNTNVEAAMQYLIWALESIEQTGNQKAAEHARLALEALRDAQPSPQRLRRLIT